MAPRASARIIFLITLALLATAPARAQSGPYVTVSSGLAAFSASAFGEKTNHTKRRDAIGAGYILSDLVALDVSYFQTQSADKTEAFAIPAGPSSFTNRDKISGFAFGPVLRWKLADGVTLFTKQSAVAITDEATDVTRYSIPTDTVTTNSNTTFWGYQPSVGLSFRLTSKAPVSLAVELNHVFASNDRIKDMTGLGVSLAYGF